MATKRTTTPARKTPAKAPAKKPAAARTKTTASKKPPAKKDTGLISEITGVGLIGLGLFSLICVFSDMGGLAGNFLRQLCFGLLGAMGYFLGLIFIWLGFVTIKKSSTPESSRRALFFGLLLLAVVVFFHIGSYTGNRPSNYVDAVVDAWRAGVLPDREAGGALGEMIAWPLIMLMGPWGALVTIFTLAIMCILLSTKVSLKTSYHKLVDFIAGQLEKWRLFQPKDEDFYYYEDEEDFLEEDEPIPPPPIRPLRGRKSAARRLRNEIIDERLMKEPEPPIMTEKPEVPEILHLPTKPDKTEDIRIPDFVNSPGKNRRRPKAIKNDGMYIETMESPLKENAPPLEDDIPPWEDEIVPIIEAEPPIKPDEIVIVNEPMNKEESLRAPIAAETAALEENEAPPPYHFPPLNLLGRTQARAYNPRDDEKAGNKLIATLDSFGVKASLTNVTHGPAITRFEIQPAPGVKVARIVSLTDDIALNMEAYSMRIEAPIPGKAAIGIEISNDVIAPVGLRGVLESENFEKHDSTLAFALGEDISGKKVVADLSKMPHLLIAGATGSGKSVCINTLVTSILYKSTPEEVQLIMIDPKVVELSVYNGIPHLRVPVVTDPKKAAGALRWAVEEMGGRYQKFAEMGARNIEGYNAQLPDEAPLMPKIVIIIDELADLMMVASSDVEDAITRLSQLARAAGIHLIIATQRPSVNVITGVIKANIPSRIAFAVSSQVDSRTIIDGAGAEKLLGRGDMLYYPTGASKPTRVQGAFVSDAEVQSVVDFVKAQRQATYDEDVMEQIDDADGEAAEVPATVDPKLAEAMEYAWELNQISISMLQRRMRIGYARAGRLIDELTVRGMISIQDGAKPREVLISREEFDRIYGDAKGKVPVAPVPPPKIAPPPEPEAEIVDEVIPEGDELEAEGDIFDEYIPKDESDEDAQIVKAMEAAFEDGQLSISSLQRHLRVGFSEAARLIELLGARGFIEKGDGSQPLEVLINRSLFLDIYGE